MDVYADNLKVLADVKISLMCVRVRQRRGVELHTLLQEVLQSQLCVRLP